jgi:hypothetical protein
MEISASLLWQAVVTLALGPLAYFLKEALGRLRDMEKCIARTRESLAREYATKADLHADVGRVLDRLDRLDSKLDRLLTERREA